METCEHNIKVDLTAVRFEGVDRLRIQSSSEPCGHGNESSGSIKGSEFLY
jgi:hypothetical protein